LSQWEEKWKQHLESASRKLPEEIDLGDHKDREIGKLMRRSRLGSMLLEEGFNAEAKTELEMALSLASRDLRLRFWLAEANLALGHKDEAFEQLQKVEPGASPDASAFALRGYLFVQRGENSVADSSFFKAISLDPWNEKVACHWLSPPGVPSEEAHRKLCEASRRWPRN
jgi:Flp pilus assembly protein TadD